MLILLKSLKFLFHVSIFPFSVLLRANITGKFMETSLEISIKTSEKESKKFAVYFFLFT